jgi:predicted RNA-binding protein with PIN domain
MKRTTPQAILLVDGYNIVGVWGELKKIRDRLGLEEARRNLVSHLTGFAAFHGYDTQVVFDAQYQDTPGTREVVTQQLSIHYTNFGQTADTYIEKACADFRQDLRKYSQRLIVATSDRAQRLTVIGYGAEWMSANQLANEIDLTVNRVRRNQNQRKQPRGRFLMNSLNPEAVEKLERLRYGK